MDSSRLLEAYDTQLRTDAETAGALAVRRLGPLHLATFPGGSGFVTYRDLGGADALEVDRLVAAALAHGGKPWLDKMEQGPMYGHSFTDPDGHVWEVLHMQQAG